MKEVIERLELVELGSVTEKTEGTAGPNCDPDQTPPPACNNFLRPKGCCVG